MNPVAPPAEIGRVTPVRRPSLQIVDLFTFEIVQSKVIAMGFAQVQSSGSSAPRLYSIQLCLDCLLLVLTMWCTPDVRRK